MFQSYTTVILPNNTFSLLQFFQWVEVWDHIRNAKEKQDVGDCFYSCCKTSQFTQFSVPVAQQKQDCISCHKQPHKELGQNPAILTSQLLNKPHIVEPQYDKGPGNWQNMFAITRFCYIGSLLHIFYHYWAKEYPAHYS